MAWCCGTSWFLGLTVVATGEVGMGLLLVCYLQVLLLIRIVLTARPGFRRTGTTCSSGFTGFTSTLIILNGIAARQIVTPLDLQARVNTTARMLTWGGKPLGAC